jgi:hypothetical protein
MWLLIGIIYSPRDSWTQDCVEGKEYTERDDKVDSDDNQPTNKDLASEIDVADKDIGREVSVEGKGEGLRKRGR